MAPAAASNSGEVGAAETGAGIAAARDNAAVPGQHRQAAISRQARLVACIRVRCALKGSRYMAYKCRSGIRPVSSAILGHRPVLRNNCRIRRNMKGSFLGSIVVRDLFRRHRGLWLASALLIPLVGVLSSFTVFEQNAQEWPLETFEEPSGLVFHEARGTIFVVGDEGDIGEVSLQGKLLRSAHLGGDLEGITYDPSSGNLYVVREGHEIIFEIAAEDFKILRRFSIDRNFAGDPNYLRRGGDGIEGLTFVPVAGHPEGGRFYAVNQYDPPVLLELALALRSSDEKFQSARIVAAKEVAPAPLSSIVWAPDIDGFLIASALWRKVYVTDSDGTYRNSVRIPAVMPEGFSPLPGGAFVIAQDSGGLVLWRPPSNPFGAKPSSGAEASPDAG